MPTASEGNLFATPNFFRGIRQIAKNEGIPFIVDETQTGVGASGKNWGHEHWYMGEDQTPDYMTFGGKSGLNGFYSTLSHRLNSSGTTFSEKLDMAKLLHYGAIWNTISLDKVYHWQGDTSTFLKIELERVGKENPGLVSNVRGYGLHLGFDSDRAESLQRWLYRTGF